jgi:micrococcal nuclease
MPDHWRQKWAITILLCLFCLLIGCQSGVPGDGNRVKVTRVVSGQTLEVIFPGKSTTQQVRLIGVSAPAWNQEPWFSTARDTLAEWIGPNSIQLETDLQTTLPYDDGKVIPLVYAWQGDRLLNVELVKAGLVLAEVRSPNLNYAADLIQSQETARLLERGIWDPEQPMRLTPAEFRSRQSSPH